MSDFFLRLLLPAAVKATLVLLAAATACGLARRAPSAFRHQVWALALAGVLILPALRTVLPVWPLPGFAVGSQLLLAAISQTGTSTPSRGPGMVVNAVQSGASALSPWSLLAGGWMLIAGLLVFRAVHGVVSLWRSTRQATPTCDPRLLDLLSECASRSGLRRKVRLNLAFSTHIMPCTWGMLRPAILLPSGSSDWSSERLRMVITHELAHIQRADWPVRLMAEAARVVFWFHPLIWFAASQMHQESERACDDAVLRAGEDAARYAAELLDLVRAHTQCPAAVLAIARPSNFERRFTSMLNPHVNRRRLTRTTALLTTSAACAGLLFMAALRAPAEENAPYLGTVTDPSGAAVVNATVTMIDQGAHTIWMTSTSSTGDYQFAALPAGVYEVRVQRSGFGDFSAPLTVASGRTSPERTVLTPLDAGQSVAPASASTPSTVKPHVIRVGGNVVQANLLRKVQPVYPLAAKQAGIQGQVQLAATLDEAGIPAELRVVNVDVFPDLARSAVETVSQWRYKPTLLNGEPIAVKTVITVNYTLAK